MAQSSEVALCSSNNDISIKSHALKLREAALNAQPLVQRQLRQNLKQLQGRCKPSQIQGTNPIELFPTEIWEMIFNLVGDNADDVITWIHSCGFFKNMLGESVVEPLFEKVMLILSSYLSENDVKTCRGVCKSWKLNTDKSLVQYWLLSKNHQAPTEKLTTNFPKLLSDMDNKSPEDSDKKKFGKLIYIPSEETDEALNDFTNVVIPFCEIRLDPEERQCMTAFWRCIQKLGKYMRNLQICEDGEANEAMDETTFYRICQQTLENCPSLKVLELQNFEFLQWIGNEEEGQRRKQQMFKDFPLRKHFSLQKLVFGINDARSLSIQDHLLQMYSDQLKSLGISNWNASYTTLPWNKLEELTILTADSLAVLNSLQTWSSVNLCSLTLKLTDKNKASLQDIMKTVKAHSNLRYLELEFLYNWQNWSDEEIMALPLDLAASGNLHTLSIHSHLKNLNHNFLICFPLLKNLVLHETYVMFNSYRPNNRELVKICKHYPVVNFYGSDSLYNSNVWEILPHLTVLRIEEKHLSYGFGHGPDRRGSREFTRNGYLWRKMTTQEKKSQLSLAISTKADYICQKQVRQHVTQTREPSSGSPALTMENENIKREKVFKILVPILGKPTILKSRLVDKNWQTTIDQVISGKAQPKFVAKFRIPLQSPEQYQHYKRHPRNPFIGKSVELTICLLTTADKYNDKTVREDFSAFLQDFGKYIFHLKLRNCGCADNCQLSNTTFYLIVIEIFRRCENLRSLDFRYLDLKYKSGTTENEMWELVRSTDLSIIKQPHFHTLLYDKLYKGPSVYYRILEVYKNQLATMSLNFEYELNGISISGKCFPQLENLVLQAGLQDSWIYDSGLKNILENKCPNLKSLEIHFAEKYEHQESLESGINEKERNSGNKAKQKQLVPREWKIFMFDVTRIKVVLQHQYQISFDFLIYFPLLQKLTIIFGDGVAHPHNSTSTSEEQTKPLTMIDRKDDFIPLALYFGNDGQDKHIYHSNIWQVLKRLNRIKLIHATNGTTEEMKHKVYTRQHYELFLQRF